MVLLLAPLQYKAKAIVRLATGHRGAGLRVNGFTYKYADTDTEILDSAARLTLGISWAFFRFFDFITTLPQVL